MMAVPMVFCKALSGTDGTAGVKRYSSCCFNCGDDSADGGLPDSEVFGEGFFGVVVPRVS